MFIEPPITLNGLPLRYFLSFHPSSVFLLSHVVLLLLAFIGVFCSNGSSFLSSWVCWTVGSCARGNDGQHEFLDLVQILSSHMAAFMLLSGVLLVLEKEINSFCITHSTISATKGQFFSRLCKSKRPSTQEKETSTQTAQVSDVCISFFALYDHTNTWISSKLWLSQSF